MKKVKSNKLSLNKNVITNLGETKGGKTEVPTLQATCVGATCNQFTCAFTCVPVTAVRCASHPYCTV